MQGQPEGMDASSWFTQTATVQVPTCLAASGSRELVWGDQTPLACRVTPQDEQFQGSDGQMITSSHLLRTDQPIDVKSRVWIPGTDTSDAQQARKVLRVRATTAKGGGYTLYRVDL